MTIKSVKIIHLDEMELRCPANDDQFIVPRPFLAVWETTFADGTIRLRVWRSPAEEWKSDLASVPRILWPIVPPHRRIKRGAVVHDGLYQFRPEFEDGRITQAEADAVLRAICIMDGIGEFEATEVFDGVSVGGEAYWHSHDAR